MFFISSCSDNQKLNKEDLQKYLADYNSKYKELFTASCEGQWAVNTHIVEGDTMNAYNSGKADQALAKFTGSNENITKANDFLKFEKELSPLELKQLKKILYLAAGIPKALTQQ